MPLVLVALDGAQGATVDVVASRGLDITGTTAIALGRTKERLQVSRDLSKHIRGTHTPRSDNGIRWGS